jgi:hypothetical protein
MVQFNLLPDVKLEFIRTRRRKRAIVALSTLMTAGSLAILVSTFMVANIYQRVTLSRLDKEIKNSSEKLKTTADIDSVLTIQSQLQSLPELHAKKPVASRLFGYLTQVTPAQVSISRVQVAFDLGTMEISGGADKIETINKFVDTLKFTQYNSTSAPVPEGQAAPNAFNGIVLSSFSRTETGATYRINLSFDPAIFAGGTEGIQLVVPQTITSRSETERPQALFTAPPETPTVTPAAR